MGCRCRRTCPENVNSSSHTAHTERRQKVVPATGPAASGALRAIATVKACRGICDATVAAVVAPVYPGLCATWQ